MRAALASLACLLAGCNQLLGLDPGLVDGDGDGVADVDDNCEAVPNPDQADVDGNGFGDACSVVPCTEPPWGIDLDNDGVDDACDGCVTGPGPVGDDTDGDGLPAECDPCPTGGGIDANGDHVEDACQAGLEHDEDADGVGDADDNCPTVANPDQANGDADEVGDACQPRVGLHDHVLFEPFASPTLPAWEVLPAGWVVQADGLVASGVLAARRISHLSPIPASDGLLEVVVTLGAGPGHDKDLATVGLSVLGSPDLWSCSLSGTGVLELRFETSLGATPPGDQVATPFLPGQQVRIRMLARTQPMLARTAYTCEAAADGMTFTTDTMDAALPRADRPFLVADGNTPSSSVRFDSVWAIAPR